MPKCKHIDSTATLIEKVSVPLWKTGQKPGVPKQDAACIMPALLAERQVEALLGVLAGQEEQSFNSPYKFMSATLLLDQ